MSLYLRHDHEGGSYVGYITCTFSTMATYIA